MTRMSVLPTPAAASNAIGRYLASCGVALWLLMLVLQPDIGFSAPPPWLAVFWALQIGIGLAVLQAALRILTRAFGATRHPVWLLVLASGLLGSLALTPLYWLIGEGLMQGVLGFPASVDDDAVIPGTPGLAAALANEFLDIVGPVTASWGLISLPRLDGLVPPMLQRATVLAVPAQGPVPAADATTLPVLPDAPGRLEAAAPLPAWRQRLPAELGQDVIAVASELQYLRVWTLRGCTLLLGALQEVEADEGDAGMRVHRSWWVDARHVLRVRSTASGTVCEMSDGRTVPVSRRRKADVVARFGEGASYHPSRPTAQTASPPAPD
jgi:hypothetical protein